MSNVNFGLWWVAVFISFPLGGLAALFSVGSVATPGRAAIAGAITGAVIGGAQWLVLRHALAVPATWIAATAIGMGAGLCIAVAVCGIEFDGNALLWRGLITGAAIGVAQAVVLAPTNGALPAIAWVPIVAVGWMFGWWIARVIGVDLTPHYTVFGSVGAIVFQVMTALVILLLRAGLSNAGRG